MNRTGLDSTSDFLDLACLAYAGADGPDRWARAAALLKGNPELGTATMEGAAATGDVAAIRSHLETHPTSHSTPGGPRSWPPLLYLCYARIPQHDAPRSLELLLASGADPCARFIAWGYPFTAITGAVGQGEQGPERLPTHPDAHVLVPRLIDAGASPNDCQALYNTMLGDDDTWLRLFLSRGLNAQDSITWPIEGGARSLDFLLANAVDQGNMARVELLLSHGANPDCVNTYNGRPSHTNALLGGHDAIAERLVRAGAAKTRLNDEQRFQRAIATGDLEQAKALQSPEVLADPQHLLNASNRGELRMVRFLLQSGAAANGADPGGVTPLHRAAWGDHTEVIRLLLTHGADPKLRENNYDATPHGWAVHNGSRAAADLLEGL